MNSWIARAQWLSSLKLLMRIRFRINIYCCILYLYIQRYFYFWFEPRSDHLRYTMRLCKQSQFELTFPRIQCYRELLWATMLMPDTDAVMRNRTINISCSHIFIVFLFVECALILLADHISIVYSIALPIEPKTNCHIYVVRQQCTKCENVYDFLW